MWDLGLFILDFGFRNGGFRILDFGMGGGTSGLLNKYWTRVKKKLHPCWIQPNDVSRKTSPLYFDGVICSL